MDRLYWRWPGLADLDDENRWIICIRKRDSWLSNALGPVREPSWKCDQDHPRLVIVEVIGIISRSQRHGR